MLCEEWRREPAPEDDRRGPALIWVFARVTSLADRDRSRSRSGDGGEPKEGFLRMPDGVETSQPTGPCKYHPLNTSRARDLPLGRLASGPGGL